MRHHLYGEVARLNLERGPRKRRVQRSRFDSMRNDYSRASCGDDPMNKAHVACLFNDDGTTRKDGDEEKCFQFATMLRDVAGMVTQYETPKLAAIAMAPPPDPAHDCHRSIQRDSRAIRLDQEKKVYQRRFKNRRITQL
jgi:hypothetical protein